MKSKIQNLLLVIFLLIPVTLLAKDFGQFTAGSNCIAKKRIKDKRGVTLTEGQRYKIVSINKKGGDYYYVQVGSQKKWVNKFCGNSGSKKTSQKSTKKKDCLKNYKGIVLAISWQPAFCEKYKYKRECKNPCGTCFEAKNFTLHGLWPDNVEYCCVSKKNEDLDERRKWHLLPELKLTSRTYNELKKVMPGALSNLHRHEWIKHGTCFGNAEEYYITSIELLEKVNNSTFRDAFITFIGKTSNADEIRALFDDTFGRGASKALDIQCSNGMITELRIHLKANLNSGNSLTSLLDKNRRGRSNCSKKFYIDPMGFK